jgi:hypothetical protein
MVAPNIEELLAAVRRLPFDERIGLMADAPEVVDRMCSAVYEARAKARMRTVDD